MRVKVSAPSRVHFGLVGIAPSYGIVDGGLGLMLSHPRMVIYLGGEASKTISPEYETAVEQLLAAGTHASALSLESQIPRHVGLGSGTQLALSVTLASEVLLRGSSTLVGPDLWRMAGRGRTSKVGCAGFDAGGLVLDLGRPVDAKSVFGPSHAAELSETHDRTMRFDFPPWDIVVAVPRRWERIFGQPERLLFAAMAQGNQSSLETAFIHERLLVPAAREGDLASFDLAMRLARDIGLKRQEIDYRGPLAAAMIADLEALGLSAVTLSSWGPAMVGFSDGFDQATKYRIQQVVGEKYDADVFWTHADNVGRRLEIVDE